MNEQNKRADLLQQASSIDKLAQFFEMEKRISFLEARRKALTRTVDILIYGSLFLAVVRLLLDLFNN